LARQKSATGELEIKVDGLLTGEEQRMSSKYQLLVPALAIIALLVSVCDPGFAYTPVNEKGTRVERWSEHCDFWDNFRHPAENVIIWPESERWGLLYENNERFRFGLRESR
jgi:hypothetical protein